MKETKGHVKGYTDKDGRQQMESNSGREKSIY